MRATKRSAAAALRLPASGVTGSAVREAAHQYVEDGEGLTTFLADLEFACEVLNLPPPSREIIKAASIAWADEFLAKVDNLVCEDPLTGMSTPEHARAHLQALYRRGRPEAHALIVVVVLLELEPPAVAEDELAAAFEQSLRLAMIAETVRATFEQCDVVAPLTGQRVLAVVRRDEFLANRADELGWLLRRRMPVSSVPHVLLEPMPATEESACALLEDPDSWASPDDDVLRNRSTSPVHGDGEADPVIELDVQAEVE